VPVYRLDRSLVFPPAHLANDQGLLAVGGDLSPERLILAYRSGIFPWYEEGLPILWHSPDPRYVLETANLHVPRSLAKRLRRGEYRVDFDTRFSDVIERCGARARPGQRGTWITRDMIEAYERLFRLGVAHSAEAYDADDQLVGGLYGVLIGRVFFGESMFATAPDASKVAFVTLVEDLHATGVDLVDCQVHTEHLERFGAEHWPRALYLNELDARVDAEPTGRPFAPRRSSPPVTEP
jgi:leucyl/phenylalanyl-tRNA--protein transferase